MAGSWKDNKANYESSQKKPEKTSFFETPVYPAAHLNYSPNPKALREARKVWPGAVQAHILLTLAGIALVWSVNTLFGTFQFMTGDYVTDSLILTAVIGGIGLLVHRRVKADREIADEIVREAMRNRPSDKEN